MGVGDLPSYDEVKWLAGNFMERTFFLLFSFSIHLT